MPIVQTRRRFLGSAAFAGAAGLLPLLRARAAEPGPETPTIKLPKTPAICTMPEMVTEQLLRAEGFTDIRHVDVLPTATEPLARGDVDLMVNYASSFIVAVDKGEATTLLAGVHVGCFELFGNAGIRTIADLKGKSVGVEALGGSDHVFASVIAAHIGLDPAHDIHWVPSRSPGPAEMFAQGKIDACLGLPRVPQDLRARHIGHVLVSSSLDQPWSQYFCCMRSSMAMVRCASNISARASTPRNSGTIC